MDLTKAALKKMCRDSGLYTSPALNDKLYLHYKVRDGGAVLLQEEEDMEDVHTILPAQMMRGGLPL